jgi:general secretion pathway protein L
MTATLLIDVLDGSGWLARAGGGVAWRSGQPVPPDVRVVAVVPAESATLLRVSLPARRAAELRQAVPFALEERLAEPVESLQFALGRRSGDLVDVALVARDRLGAWLAALVAQGISADAMVADAHLLVDADAQPRVARVGDRVLLACAEGAFALPAQDWPRWRTALDAGALQALGADGRWHAGSEPAALDRIAALRALADRVEHAPDLLQGEFAPRRRLAGRRRQWRWAAGLAAAAVLLALVEAGAGVLLEQQRRAQLRAQMAQVFSQTLPDARMTADPAAQLAAELGRLQRAGGAQGGPFALLATVAPQLSQGSRYRLASMDWRLGMLELEIATADVAALDALREALAAAGLAVEVTGVAPDAAGVRGRLRVRAAA